MEVLSEALDALEDQPKIKPRRAKSEGQIMTFDIVERIKEIIL